MDRRKASDSGRYELGTPDDPIPDSVRRFHREVHRPGIYDLERNTAQLSPEECARAIQRRRQEGPSPTAFRHLAAAEAR